MSEMKKYATRDARDKAAPVEVERKKITTGKPPTAVAPLISPEKQPTLKVHPRPTVCFDWEFFNNNKLAVSTIPETSSCIGLCGTFVRIVIPKGVPSPTPKINHRKIFQSIFFQTSGSM